MNPATETAGLLPNDRLSHAAFVFAFIAAAAGLVSIALSHTCLVLSLLLLILSKTPVRFPPVVLPLIGFCSLTVASMLASDDVSSGWPQIKKFFVFAFLISVYSLLTRLGRAYRLVEAWFVLAFVASLWSVIQFIYKWRQAEAAGEDFYEAYIGDRISGFFSHWMTFSEINLMIFLLMASYLMFSERARSNSRVVWFACGFVMALSLLLSFTRSVWLALLVAGGYLIWNWNKKLLWAAPVALVIVVLLAPGAARRRITSIVQPSENSARLIMWETGWNMVRRHPWLGVGPERVGPLFREYMPDDVGQLPDAYYGHLHNVFIHYAAERGLPAALMILWLLGKILWDHARALTQLPRGRSDQRFLIHGVLACTLAVVVVGTFDLTLGDSEILAVYLSIVALGYGVVSSVSKRAATG